MTHIRKYEVMSGAVTGKQNKRYTRGQIVPEHKFYPGHAEQLVVKGHLRSLDKPEQPKGLTKEQLSDIRKEIASIKVGVLVPTRGNRPEFLQQCKHLISQQTVAPFKVLIRDEKPDNDLPDITKRYRLGSKQLFSEGCTVVLFWEDDDWYAPNYIERMLFEWIKAGKPQIFGVGQSTYYHLFVHKYHTITHPGRASNMATLVTKAVTKIEWCSDDFPYTDLHLWKVLDGATFVPEKPVCMGLKHGIGMVGGGGHQHDWYRYDNDDKHEEHLLKTTGSDFLFYHSFTARDKFNYSFNGKKANPFLSIVTRRYKRPNGLKKNLESVEALGTDVQHVFITDPVGHGMLEANRAFYYGRHIPIGKYVYLLDDDDFIVNPNMVKELKQITKDHNDPDVILFRMTIKNGQNNNHYPTNTCWEDKPYIAHIGGSCFVVKREVWLKHIHHFGHTRCGDFHFINAVWQDNPTVYWHDVLMAETGKVSRGKPEETKVIPLTPKS